MELEPLNCPHAIHSLGEAGIEFPDGIGAPELSTSVAFTWIQCGKRFPKANSVPIGTETGNRVDSNSRHAHSLGEVGIELPDGIGAPELSTRDTQPWKGWNRVPRWIWGL